MCIHIYLYIFVKLNLAKSKSLYYNPIYPLIAEKAATDVRKVQE